LNPCLSPETCLAYRPLAFFPHENLTLDQWQRIPCGVCVIGTARAEDVARNRPPTCAHDDCELRPSQGNEYYCHHTSRRARARKMGKPCKKCKVPLGPYSVKEFCLDCRPKARKPYQLNKKKSTHCKNEHEKTAENQIGDKFGHVRCRVCNRESSLRRMREIRERRPEA
jgi:hypothetical protein